MSARRPFTDLFDLAFPPLCNACRQRLLANEQTLCLHCEFTLPETLFHHQRENPLWQMLRPRLPIESATALYYYGKESRVQALIHQLKYRGVQAVGDRLGRKLAEGLALQPEANNFAAVIPVPLHPAKRRRRGYNQSDSIARGVAEVLDRPFRPDALRRRTDTASQTRKTIWERWQGVSTVFERSRTADDLRGRHLLLIDDVITTGSTLEACANRLLELGDGTRVSVAALAWADSSSGG